MKREFLTAEWRNLIMANYVIDPNILKKHMPNHTELELRQGKCYLSLVGFMFLNTKVLGVHVPFYQNFEEVNLRFYVRYREKEEWRRGVVFIKEIVPKAAIAFVANHLYQEHYITLPMQRHWEEHSDSKIITYEWKIDGNWDFMKVKTTSEATELAPGSEEEFITQHYWGYTKINDRQTSEYRVEHPPWKVYSVSDYQIDCHGERLYGAPFGEILKEAPNSIFMATGSEIKVRARRKL